MKQPCPYKKSFYLSTIGSDNLGDGSAGNPFQTFKKVQTEVRKSIALDQVKTIIVNVEPGKYFLDSPIVFTKEDSPKDGNKVFYRANKKKPTDEVEISGAKTLKIAGWVDCPDNPKIKVAQLEAGMEIDILFVDKNEQMLARYPNYNSDAVPLGGTASMGEIKRRVARYKNPAGGYIRTLHNAKWGGNSYIITGKDDSNPLGLAYKWVGDNNRGSGMEKNSIVIENVFEELDAPNEWFYDRLDGKLYYYPGDNIDLNTAVFEGAVTSELIKIVGEKDGIAARNIVIDGFTFWGTKRTLFTVDETGKEYVPLLRGDWCVVRAGAVFIQDAEDITLQNLNFINFGGNGIFISGYNKGHLIDNNEFINAGSSCIQVVGLPEAVYEPSFWEHEYYLDKPEFTVHKTTIDNTHQVGPKTENYPRDITISKNHMYNIGTYEKQSSGVNLSVSRGIRILSNTIHRCARSCINVNDGTFGGHEIAYNDLYDSQRETTDHGPFNSWGRDRFWSVPEYNAQGLFGEQIRPYALIDAVDTTAIHDNRFHHDPTMPHTWGIDLDDGSTNYDIYNNLGLNVGVKLREGFDRKVHNNIFIDGQLQIHCTYKYSDDKVYSNIVLNSDPWKFAGQVDGDKMALLEGNYTVARNWYYNYGEQVTIPDFFESLNLDFNAVYNVDPAFKSTENNDYTVTNVSAMDKTGFTNFPMNRFGKPDCSEKAPVYAKTSRQAQKNQLQEEFWLDAVISNIDDAIVSSTASSGLLGVFFAEVPENSAAYAIGFRKLDIVKKINTTEIQSKTHFLELMRQVDSNNMVIEIFRKTKCQEITLKRQAGNKGFRNCETN